ncbi:MAG: hypothetical protein IPL61_20635 [Myxococcales bacterium]|nr:hypothetical protein [Myxococcales bacterium]
MLATVARAGSTRAGRWRCLRFLTRDEGQALVARTLGYPRLDETFEHMT